eukprot:8227128-Alexandrium_andersonii.AAC.1
MPVAADWSRVGVESTTTAWPGRTPKTLWTVTHGSDLETRAPPRTRTRLEDTTSRTCKNTRS